MNTHPTATVLVIPTTNPPTWAHLTGPTLTLDQLRTLHPDLATIHWFDIVAGPHNTDLWVDDEALLTTNPQFNLIASLLAHHPIYGPAVATNTTPDGNTTGLTTGQQHTLTHLTAPLN